MSKKQSKKEESEVNAVTEDTLQAEDANPEIQDASEDKPGSLEENPDAVIQNDELLAKIQQIQAEKEELYNRLLRCQADFDNFRRRSRQEYEQACLYGCEGLIKKILPAIDNLEPAVAACNNDGAESSGLKDGVQLTLKQLMSILTGEGLEVIESLNRPFDPLVHEAVLQEQSAAVSEPTVVEELQKGYKYKDKLLRPALVKVAVP